MENARAILSLENWLNYSLDNFDSIVNDEKKKDMMRIVIKKMPETFYTNFFHILTVNDNGDKMKKFVLDDSELTGLFSEYLNDVSGFTDKNRTDRNLSESDTNEFDKLSKILDTMSAKPKNNDDEFRTLDK